MQPDEKQTIAIIGAGIVGVSCAIHLQRLGKKVIIIDRLGVGEATSFGNAGVLACSSIVPVATPGILWKVPRLLFNTDGPLFLKWRHLPVMLPWLIHYIRASRKDVVEHIAKNMLPLVKDSVDEHYDISKDSKAKRWIKKTPYLFLYKNYQEYKKDAYSWNLRKKHGFEWEVLLDDELHKCEETISKDYKCGVLLQSHGMITNPGEYVKDLANTAIDSGAKLLIANVNEVQHNDDGVVIKTDGDDVIASCAVIASGVWSDKLSSRCGANVPLESERGYHIELVEPSVQPSMPIMDVAHKFVVTPMQNGLRFAGIVEFGGLNAPASSKPVDLLMRNAKSLFPGLQFCEKRVWLGHRPSTADSLPVMGKSPKSENIYFCYGHCHTGLTAAPKTARMVAEMIVGIKPNIDVSAYRPDRYN